KEKLLALFPAKIPRLARQLCSPIMRKISFSELHRIRLHQHSFIINSPPPPNIWPTPLEISKRCRRIRCRGCSCREVLEGLGVLCRMRRVVMGRVHNITPAHSLHEPVAQLPPHQSELGLSMAQTASRWLMRRVLNGFSGKIQFRAVMLPVPHLWRPQIQIPPSSPRKKCVM